jgi:hypothetical protein
VEEFLHRRAEIKAGVKNSPNDAVNETETSRFEWRDAEAKKGGEKKRVSAPLEPILWRLMMWRRRRQRRRKVGFLLIMADVRVA